MSDIEGEEECGWTHLICDRCWHRVRPNRDPFRMKVKELKPCCWCGTHTSSAIYMRWDPKSTELQCQLQEEEKINE